MENGRDFAPITHGIPMPTSNIKVGKGNGINGGNPTAWRSTTPHTSTGVTAHATMGDFPLRPPAHVQSQRKLTPWDFKKLVEKFDGTKDPHYHMANIR